MAPRRTLEETRALLLETGTQMLVDSAIDVTVGRLSVLDVCRQAGLTSAGSAYKIWTSQDDFRVELLRHLVSRVIDGTTGIEAVAASFMHGELPSTFVEFVRIAGQQNIDAYRNTHVYALYLSLWIASDQDAELATSIRHADADWLASFAALYETIGAAYGLTVVEPFTIDGLVLSVTALVEGFVIRSRVHPERVNRRIIRASGPDGSDQEWHLFACAAQGIIEAFTRPLSPAESE